MFKLGKNGDKHVTYRHHDGNPSNVLADLRDFQRLVLYFHSPISTLTIHPFVPVHECIAANWLAYRKSHVHQFFCTGNDRKFDLKSVLKGNFDSSLVKNEEFYLEPKWSWFGERTCDYHACLHPTIHEEATFVRWIHELQVNKAPWQVTTRVHDEEATSNGAVLIFKDVFEIDLEHAYQEQVAVYHRGQADPSTITRQLNDFFTILRKFYGHLGKNWVNYLRASSTAANWIFFMKRGLEYWLLYANSMIDDRPELCLTDYESCPHGVHGDISFYHEVELDQFEQPWVVTSSPRDEKW